MKPLTQDERWLTCSDHGRATNLGALIRGDAWSVCPFLLLLGDQLHLALEAGHHRATAGITA